MKHALFTAAMIMLIALIATLQALTALAPLKWWILRHYAWPIVSTLAVTFAVLTATLYRLLLLVPLRNTGRKLTHVDHQLSSPDAVFEDLTLPEEESTQR